MNSVKLLEEFECGCNIIKDSEWRWRIITCLNHSKHTEKEGYHRLITLDKPIMEMIHP